MEAIVPLIIVTGFLGAGKTTLLSRILEAAQVMHKKVAVMQNEFAAEFALESEILPYISNVKPEAPLWEEIVEFDNSCVCCSSSGEFLRAVGKFANARERIDMIVLETTGRADPGPIVRMLSQDPYLRERLQVALIVTVVDSLNAEDLLNRDWGSFKNELREQIAVADIIILNKTDLVAKEKVAHLRKLANEINPFEPDIIETQFSQVDAQALLQRAESSVAKVATRGDLSSLGTRMHAPSIVAMSVYVEPLKRPVNNFLQIFNDTLQQIVTLPNSRILRLKALIQLSDTQQAIVQGVQNSFSVSVVDSQGATAMSRLAIVGESLDEKRIEALFDSCFE